MGRVLAFLVVATLASACASPRPPQAPSVPRGEALPADDEQIAERPDSEEPDSEDDESPPKRTIVIDDIVCYILPQIYFTKGSAKVLPDSREMILAVSTSMLNDAKTFELVDVEGSADWAERGAVALSRARAQAVVDALVANGVERWRVRATGYGAHCSEVTSDPDEQGKNRSVRFKVTRTAQGDSGAERGCEAATRAGLPPPPLPESPFKPGERPYARPARNVPP